MVEVAPTKRFVVKKWNAADSNARPVPFNLTITSEQLPQWDIVDNHDETKATSVRAGGARFNLMEHFKSLESSPLASTGIQPEIHCPVQ